MLKNSIWLVGILVVATSVLTCSGALAAQDMPLLGRGNSVTQEVTDPPVLPLPSVLTDPHPVIQAMAEYFGVPYEEIQTLFDSGVGLGVIAQAYLLGDLVGFTPQELIEMKASGEVDWGQLLKDAGLELARRHTNLGAIMSSAGKGKGADKDTDLESNALHEQDRERDQERQQERQQDRLQQREQEQDKHQDRTGGGKGGDGGQRGRKGK